MTEDQIERLVQHRTDRLDREYNTLLQSLSRAA